MIERFFIKRFFLYPFINRFKLWGGLIFFHNFARRGIFFGYLCALAVGSIAVSFFLSVEFILGILLDFGMPHWLYLAFCVLYLVPLAGLTVITFDLFFVGIRAPNQFLIGSIFWSESHENRWKSYMSWLVEQKNGTKE